MFATKHLTASFNDIQVECNLSNASLSDTSSPEELTSYCGVTRIPGIRAYELAVSGWADWGEEDSICDLIHAAAIAEPAGEIDVVLEVAGATRTFVAVPTQDLPFGSEAGVQTFETTLSVKGEVTDGVAATTP